MDVVAGFVGFAEAVQGRPAGQPTAARDHRPGKARVSTCCTALHATRGLSTPARRPVRRYADSWLPGAQWLATTGRYTVFLLNPRGRRRPRLRRERHWRGKWTDILTGLDLLVAQGVADPRSLGIVGSSHGGLVAAWTVGQTDRFRAALASASVVDWGMLSGTGPHSHVAVSPVSCPPHPHPGYPFCTASRTSTCPWGKPCISTEHYDTSTSSTIRNLPERSHTSRERNHQLDVQRRTRTWFDRWLLL